MVENDLSPIKNPTSLMVSGIKLWYLSLDDIIGSFRPRLDFLTSIVLQVPTMGGRYFDFTVIHFKKN